VPSVLWCCRLGGRKGIWLVKTEWWGAGVVVCLEQGADLHMAKLTPLPLIVSCFRKIQIGFTFLVPAHLGSPGKRAVKWVCVCCLGLPGWASTRRVKPIWIFTYFTEARDSEWQWHPLGHMQVCTSLQTDNHASTPLLSFFTGRMPFLPPNLQSQSTEGKFNLN